MIKVMLHIGGERKDHSINMKLEQLASYFRKCESIFIINHPPQILQMDRKLMPS